MAVGKRLLVRQYNAVQKKENSLFCSVILLMRIGFPVYKIQPLHRLLPEC